jgi:hypothetical protein
MVNRKEDEQSGHYPKYEAPGKSCIAGNFREVAGRYHHCPLTKYHGQAVKQASHANKGGLFRGVEALHVKAIGGNVVRGGAKGHQPKKEERVK